MDGAAEPCFDRELAGCSFADERLHKRLRGLLERMDGANALFAGSDRGAEHWAVIASLIETCKLNAIDPLGYLTDVLTRIVSGHPNSRIGDLLPCAYARHPESKAVA